MSAPICACGHSEDDHRRNGGECLEDECECTAFEVDFLSRPSGRLRRDLRRAAGGSAGAPAARRAVKARRTTARRSDERRALCAARRMEPALHVFVNALRSVLDLDPLYARVATPAPKSTHSSPEVLAAMRALAASGAKQKEIARELGVSQAHVSRSLRRAA